MLTSILKLIIQILRGISESDMSSTAIIIIAVVAILAVILLVVLPILLAILFHVFISWYLARTAKKKGHGFLFTVIICLILGLPAYLYAVALPNVAKQKQLEAEINALQTVTLQCHAPLEA